ncbi:nitroreductase/quinone reductase family protein [Nocardia mikamii]|uniref:nitroreductase/quinone reductase family protein n=1 Tax=Nocardia mikamii TaxID=508464 RepID=UPI000A04F764|nr:nitroreductase/quinone reductase family protein [Nocardia mikamii]
MVGTTRAGAAVAFWRVTGPGVRFLAPVNPWWVVLETTGRKSGLPRRRPLVRGPMDGNSMLLLGLHGRRTDWVRNIEADPTVRLRVWFRWRTGRATVGALTAEDLARFNAYARAAATTFKIEDDPGTSTGSATMSATMWWSISATRTVS